MNRTLSIHGYKFCNEQLLHVNKYIINFFPGYGPYSPGWARYKLWQPNDIKCHGIISRQICVFSVGDLPGLIHSPFMFANKFFYDYQPLAYDCLEGWYHKKVQAEKSGKLDFNTSIYENTMVVKHHF